MVINLDSDLSCLICGTVIVLTVRRQSDIYGIRKKTDAPIGNTWRMDSIGTQRRKGKRRKFLGNR